MPELPEVETTKNALSKNILNATLKKVEIFNNKLRWKIPDSFSTDLIKVVLARPYRLGKYILIPENKELIQEKKYTNKLVGWGFISLAVLKILIL